MQEGFCMEQRVPLNEQQVLVRRWPSEIPLFVVILVLSIILWIAIILGTMGIGLIYAIFIGLIFFFAHLSLIMHLRGSAVQLGPDQFPELYNRVVELSAKAGLKRTPDAYILCHQILPWQDHHAVFRSVGSLRRRHHCA
jgi:hypothetical protein